MSIVRVQFRLSFKIKEKPLYEIVRIRDFLPLFLNQKLDYQFQKRNTEKGDNGNEAKTNRTGGIISN
jgi:hypothetical protein